MLPQPWAAGALPLLLLEAHVRIAPKRLYGEQSLAKLGLTPFLTCPFPCAFPFCRRACDAANRHG